MSDFPRTTIGGVSVSRLIAGTNWFLGFSHTSKAKDRLIKRTQTARRIADVLEVFVREGVDTLLGMRPNSVIVDAVREAEDRTGKEIITIGTPQWDVTQVPMDPGVVEEQIEAYAEIGVRICMPHQAVTDALLNRRSRSIPEMDEVCKSIRDHGMVPGLSTHMPETVRYADQTDLDVEAYIQIYNAAGFLMQLEVDWVYQIIRQAKHPVITIKPLGAGRLLPIVGLGFVWGTIREQDMVTIGCYSPDEAAEAVEISRAMIERRTANVELQKTRSKEALMYQAPDISPTTE
jgi:hypothetical protein